MVICWFTDGSNTDGDVGVAAGIFKSNATAEYSAVLENLTTLSQAELYASKAIATKINKKHFHIVKHHWKRLNRIGVIQKPYGTVKIL